jgi:hypothetical protein
VLFEMFSGGHELLVVPAERRAAIAGDEARGLQPVGMVAPHLGHRQAHQRLRSRHEYVAGSGGVFLVETDRALVDSHVRL